MSEERRTGTEAGHRKMLLAGPSLAVSGAVGVEWAAACMERVNTAIKAR